MAVLQLKSILFDYYHNKNYSIVIYTALVFIRKHKHILKLHRMENLYLKNKTMATHLV